MSGNVVHTAAQQRNIILHRWVLGLPYILFGCYGCRQRNYSADML